jgi:hypothetical protein
VLHYIPPEAIDPEELLQLQEAARIPEYKQELSAFLSYMKYLQSPAPDRFKALPVEPRNDAGYIAANSTRSRAYDYFLKDLEKRAADRAEKGENLLKQAEILLKYFPGDEKVLKLLENRVKEGDTRVKT